MKRIFLSVLSMICIPLFMAVSCNKGVDNAGNQVPSDQNNNTYLAGYTGQYLAEVPETWKEEYVPNMTAVVVFYADKTCSVSIGFWSPSHREHDVLSLVYTVEKGVITMRDENSIRFTIRSRDYNPEIDPYTELSRYLLSSEITLTVEQSSGPVWDTYAEAFDWPSQLALRWVGGESTFSVR